jgi:hypothetical protein
MNRARVGAETPKRKAAQLGQIKKMTEDPQSGSLSMTLRMSILIPSPR